MVEHCIDIVEVRVRVLVSSGLPRYCQSSTKNFENHIHLFKSSVQIHVLHSLTCMVKGFNSIDRNQAFESHNNPHVFSETRENLSLTKDSVSRYFLPWIMFYLTFLHLIRCEKNRISRCELFSTDSIHKWRLFYFCSFIVQISLPMPHLRIIILFNLAHDNEAW